MDTDLLSDTFIELADTMVADFDVIDFLHLLTSRSVALLAASAAGVVLADPRGELRVAAASSEESRLLELFQLQNDQGPCLECFRTGRPVTAADLAGQAQQWPRFSAAATQAGFRTVQALPMRLRDQVIGALNLFGAGSAPFSPEDLRIGQALADVATIGLLHERNVRRRETAAEQLQAALNSRVTIEQAKGKLAERLGIDMDRAFAILRDYARNSNQHLTDVARDFVDGATAEFPPPARPRAARTEEGAALVRSRRYRRGGTGLPATLRRSSQEAQDAFTAARDSAVQVYGETDQADRAAFTALKENFEKRGDHWIPKRDPAG